MSSLLHKKERMTSRFHINLKIIEIFFVMRKDISILNLEYKHFQIVIKRWKKKDILSTKNVKLFNLIDDENL